MEKYAAHYPSTMRLLKGILNPFESEGKVRCGRVKAGDVAGAKVNKGN